jgi:hypothetical protein
MSFPHPVFVDSEKHELEKKKTTFFELFFKKKMETFVDLFFRTHNVRDCFLCICVCVCACVLCLCVCVCV